MGAILVTGGAGFVGSHVVKKLGAAGYCVITFDNLSTGHEWAVLEGKLIIGDVRQAEQLRRVFAEHRIDAVIHMAASVVVPESVANPLKYYDNNLLGTLTLLQVMQEFGVNKFIFSSTAAVYGSPASVPVTETTPINPINPYGWGKAMAEQVLADLDRARVLRYVALRYFNAAGADPEARIGEGKETATHLVTQCLRTAAGLNPYLKVYGTDYPTPDGTCIRDYIHVEDLAAAHLDALTHLNRGGESGIFNCGSSRGYSVLEVVETAKKVTGIDFRVIKADRRPGDPPVLIADSTRARQVLGWQPRFDSLETIIATAWTWEQKRSRTGRSK